MDRQQAATIYRKYREGTATPEELALLERAYLRLAEEQDLPPYDAEAVNAAMWQAVAPRKARRLRLLPYAAAAVLLLAVGWLLIVDSRRSTDSLAATEILPGGNRATLTLADGRVINLDEAHTGIVVSDENITYDDGTSLTAVIPSEAEESLPNLGDGSVMLSLTTPKGGTYQITLPDGSKVWLNSASTLKYPSRFSGDSRAVILEGEAFFDIQPKVRNVETHEYASFNVQTAGQVVQVLGTSFNISAYADDPETKTTLVEGSVKVTPGTQTGLATNDLRLTTNVLSPGQQATTRGAATTINTVDTEQYTAWKDGYFKFDGNLRSIMAQLARWYDVSVEYRGIGDSTELIGDISRYRTLADVLEALEATGKVRFKVESDNGERRVVVMP